MKMVSVTSRTIAAIGYENPTLYIRFHSGGTYAYMPVPNTVYDALLGAQSKGTYFAENIKNRYAWNSVSINQ